jgi:hypothetical protein
LNGSAYCSFLELFNSKYKAVLKWYIYSLCFYSHCFW